jgi:hypothetical protein
MNGRFIKEEEEKGRDFDFDFYDMMLAISARLDSGVVAAQCFFFFFFLRTAETP